MIRLKIDLSYIYFRFMSGMGHVGTFMMSFNLALECVGPKYRTVFGILIETPFAIGGLIVGLVSWAGVREWKLLTLGREVLLFTQLIFSLRSSLSSQPCPLGSLVAAP